MVVLADVGVDGCGRTGVIVIIAHGHDEVGAPTVNEVGNALFGGAGVAEVTNDGKMVRRLGWQGDRREGPGPAHICRS